ncbi:MAG: tyrosine-type recombinase/integrase [Moraxellaceae bacterium]|nr:tyrosine-type recombinase/integrase [Moraxellaceae bacterium]
MNRRRSTNRTLTGSRIYLRRGKYQYFAPEAFMNPASGRVTRWHILCTEAEGELVARNKLDEMLGRVRGVNGAGDFGIWFGKWKAKVLADRAARGPKDPARAAVWATGTKAVASQLGVVVNGFADFNLVEIQPPDVAQFVDQWEGRRSAQSYLTYLNQFFVWCVRKGLMLANPARDIKVQKAETKKILMTAEQYLAIQVGARTDLQGRPTRSGEMLCCYMDLLYLLYQRGTDVRLLKWNEVNGHTLPVKPTKTERSSGIMVALPITDEIRGVLARAKAAAKVASIYVIANTEGQPYTAHGIGSLFEDACDRAGVSGVTLKSIRTMAATAAKRAGYSVEQLQVALAHTDKATTLEYVLEQEAPVSEVVLTLPTPRLA